MNQETLNIAYFIAAVLFSLFIIHRMLSGSVRFRGFRSRRYSRRISRIDNEVSEMQRDVMELMLKNFPERFNNIDNDNK